jgi:hypothetical protein
MNFQYVYPAQPGQNGATPGAYESDAVLSILGSVFVKETSTARMKPGASVKWCKARPFGV